MESLRYEAKMSIIRPSDRLAIVNELLLALNEDNGSGLRNYVNYIISSTKLDENGVDNGAIAVGQYLSSSPYSKDLLRCWDDAEKAFISAKNKYEAVLMGKDEKKTLEDEANEGEGDGTSKKKKTKKKRRDGKKIKPSSEENEEKELLEMKVKEMNMLIGSIRNCAACIIAKVISCDIFTSEHVKDVRNLGLSIIKERSKSLIQDLQSGFTYRVASALRLIVSIADLGETFAREIGIRIPANNQGLCALVATSSKEIRKTKFNAKDYPDVNTKYFVNLFRQTRTQRSLCVALAVSLLKSGDHNTISSCLFSKKLSEENSESFVIRIFPHLHTDYATDALALVSALQQYGLENNNISRNIKIQFFLSNKFLNGMASTLNAATKNTLRRSVYNLLSSIFVNSGYGIVKSCYRSEVKIVDQDINIALATPVTQADPIEPRANSSAIFNQDKMIRFLIQMKPATDDLQGKLVESILKKFPDVIPEYLELCTTSLSLEPELSFVWVMFASWTCRLLRLPYVQPSTNASLIDQVKQQILPNSVISRHVITRCLSHESILVQSFALDIIIHTLYKIAMVRDKICLNPSDSLAISSYVVTHLIPDVPWLINIRNITLKSIETNDNEKKQIQVRKLRILYAKLYRVLELFAYVAPGHVSSNFDVAKVIPRVFLIGNTTSSEVEKNNIHPDVHVFPLYTLVQLLYQLGLRGITWNTPITVEIKSKSYTVTALSSILLIKLACDDLEGGAMSKRLNNCCLYIAAQLLESTGLIDDTKNWLMIPNHYFIDNQQHSKDASGVVKIQTEIWEWIRLVKNVNDVLWFDDLLKYTLVKYTQSVFVAEGKREINSSTLLYMAKEYCESETLNVPASIKFITKNKSLLPLKVLIRLIRNGVNALGSTLLDWIGAKSTKSKIKISSYLDSHPEGQELECWLYDNLSPSWIVKEMEKVMKSDDISSSLKQPVRGCTSAIMCDDKISSIDNIFSDVDERNNHLIKNDMIDTLYLLLRSSMCEDTNNIHAIVNIIPDYYLSEVASYVLSSIFLSISSNENKEQEKNIVFDQTVYQEFLSNITSKCVNYINGKGKYGTNKVGFHVLKKIISLENYERIQQYVESQNSKEAEILLDTYLDMMSKIAKNTTKDVCEAVISKGLMESIKKSCGNILDTPLDNWTKSTEKKLIKLVDVIYRIISVGTVLEMLSLAMKKLETKSKKESISLAISEIIKKLLSNLHNADDLQKYSQIIFSAFDYMVKHQSNAVELFADLLNNSESGEILLILQDKLAVDDTFASSLFDSMWEKRVNIENSLLLLRRIMAINEHAMNNFIERVMKSLKKIVKSSEEKKLPDYYEISLLIALLKQKGQSIINGNKEFISIWNKFKVYFFKMFCFDGVENEYENPSIVLDIAILLADQHDETSPILSKDVIQEHKKIDLKVKEQVLFWSANTKQRMKVIGFDNNLFEEFISFSMSRCKKALSDTYINFASHIIKEFKDDITSGKSDTVVEKLKKFALLLASTTITAKSMELVGDIVRVLSKYCKSNKTEFATNEILGNLIGNSDFLDIFVGVGVESLKYRSQKTQIARCIYLLTKADPISTVNKKLLPMILGAYNASLSECDQYICQLLDIYEKYDASPLLCGYAFGTHISPEALDAQTSLPELNVSCEILDKGEERKRILAILKYIDTQFSWIFEIDTERLIYTIRRYPSDMEYIQDERAKELYFDPHYILKILDYVLNLYTICCMFIDRFKEKRLFEMIPFNATKYAESYLIGFVLSSLSSDDEKIRQLAGTILYRFGRLASQNEKLRERNQILLILKAFKDGIQQDNQQMPPMICCFIGEFFRVLMRPKHEQFTSVNRFLLSRPWIDVSDVPMFYALFKSGNELYLRNRGWILRYIRFGIQSHLDLALLARRHVIPVLMSLFSSKLSNMQEREIIVDIFLRASSIGIHLNKNLLFGRNGADNAEATASHRYGSRLFQKSGFFQWFSVVLNENSDTLHDFPDLLYSLLVVTEICCASTKSDLSFDEFLSRDLIQGLLKKNINNNNTRLLQILVHVLRIVYAYGKSNQRHCLQASDVLIIIECINKCNATQSTNSSLKIEDFFSRLTQVESDGKVLSPPIDIEDVPHELSKYISFCIGNNNEMNELVAWMKMLVVDNISKRIKVGDTFESKLEILHWCLLSIQLDKRNLVEFMKEYLIKDVNHLGKAACMSSLNKSSQWMQIKKLIQYDAIALESLSR